MTACSRCNTFLIYAVSSSNEISSFLTQTDARCKVLLWARLMCIPEMCQERGKPSQDVYIQEKG
jgi:hypothetical protein